MQGLVDYASSSDDEENRADADAAAAAAPFQDVEAGNGVDAGEDEEEVADKEAEGREALEEQEEEEEEEEEDTLRLRKKLKVKNRDEEFATTSSTSPLEKLQRMGFSSDDIQRASEECNSTDFDEILEYLLENDNAQDQEDDSDDDSDAADDEDDDGIRAQLRLMGFSSDAIRNALAKSGSRDIEAVLSTLIREQDSSPCDISEQPQICNPGDNGIEDEIRSKLKGMGFSSNQVQNALLKTGSHDVEVVLGFLVGEEGCSSLRGMSEKSEVHNDSSNPPDDDGVRSQLRHMGFSVDEIQNAFSKSGKPDIDCVLGFLFGEECSTSQGRNKHKVIQYSHHNTSLMNNGESSYSRALDWTRRDLRRWYTYIGRKSFYHEQLERCTRKSDDDDDMSEVRRFDDRMYVLDMGRSKQRKAIMKQMDPSSMKMIGFGIPGLVVGRPKDIPLVMQGPPYFYFENVALAPKTEWDTIKRHFNGVDPEFTDAKHFSACRRPRGYVHNLPIEDREATLPIPPKTIFDAFPYAKKYWPEWDTREKFNCINTRRGADGVCELIRDLFVQYGGVLEIPLFRQREILQAVKKWNLIWVGPGQTAPLELHEVELLLGFDRDHTRGCLTMTDRYDLLGNSFQVDTVAYHFSPLRYLYSEGITVLSLFSGIGGAEVALHKVGIFFKYVISVEVNEKARKVLASWWQKSGQKGELIFKDDVRSLTDGVLEGLIDRVGRIDLVVGGSPCNNLSGNNRVSRVGLSGKESSLFYEFPRILSSVKRIMHQRGYI